LTVGEVVKRLREERGWTQQQLSAYSGLSRSYISLLEIGEIEKPSGKVMGRLAQAFRMSLEDLHRAVGYLPGEGLRPRGIDEILDEARAAAPLAIPVVEQPASAGPGQVVLDYVYMSPREGRHRNLVAVPVKGSCMAPRIEEGDIVVVDRGASPQDGQVVVATVENEVLVKRFYRHRDYIELRPDHGEPVKASEAQIVGVVIQIVKRP
jgi:repressor LexA